MTWGSDSASALDCIAQTDWIMRLISNEEKFRQKLNEFLDVAPAWLVLVLFALVMLGIGALIYMVFPPGVPWHEG
jgi:hypothetical protein